MHRLVFRRPEAVAALVGVAIVVSSALLLRSSGSSHQSRRVATIPTVIASRTEARSPVGAVAAATDDLVALTQAALSSSETARALVDADVVGPLKPKFEGALPVVAAAVEARLARGQSPAVLNGWPLGYRVVSFSRATARVAIWTLDIGVSSALPIASTDYETTTLTLRWVGGRWRIAAASSAAGPTPPSDVSSPAGMDLFAREARAYRWYRDEP